MEKISRVRLVLMLSLVLGFVIGQSLAACSEDCLGNCLPGARSGDINACIRQCLKQCKPPNSASVDTLTITDAETFCKLRCVSSLCANLATEKKPGDKRAKSCVEFCSKTCTKI